MSIGAPEPQEAGFVALKLTVIHTHHLTTHSSPFFFFSSHRPPKEIRSNPPAMGYSLDRPQ
jgi:hypothetical protein